MKPIILAAALASLSLTAFADNYVGGYTRSNGTYVHGYERSDSNSTRNDNYSTRGNTNPYTGERGYKPTDEDLGGSSLGYPDNSSRSLYGN